MQAYTFAAGQTSDDGHREMPAQAATAAGAASHRCRPLQQSARVTWTAALAEATSCSRKVSLGSSSPSARMGMLAPSRMATPRASHSSGDVCLRGARAGPCAQQRPRRWLFAARSATAFVT